MNKKSSKILTLVSGVIGLIGFYFFVGVLMEGDEAIEAMLADETVRDTVVSPFINFAKLLLILVATTAVAFSMLNLFKQPQVLKRTLLGIAVLAVFLGIAYLIASDGIVTDSMGNMLEGGEAGSVSKWVSTLINYSFILGTIGLLFFLLDFGKSLIK